MPAGNIKELLTLRTFFSEKIIVFSTLIIWWIQKLFCIFATCYSTSDEERVSCLALTFYFIKNGFIKVRTRPVHY
jgi:hypothetical protein